MLLERARLRRPQSGLTQERRLDLRERLALEVTARRCDLAAVEQHDHARGAEPLGAPGKRWPERLGLLLSFDVLELLRGREPLIVPLLEHPFRFPHAARDGLP